MKTAPEIIPKESDHHDREHAPCSPSTLKARSICPSWVNDTTGPEHHLTNQGIRIHEACERWVIGEPPGLTDDEDIDLYEWCIEDTLDILGGTIEDWTLTAEMLCDTGIPDVWGFADLVGLDRDPGDGPTEAILIDYKTGWNKQDPAETNIQGKAYALGLFKEFPTLDTIHIAFTYPRRKYRTATTRSYIEIPLLESHIKEIRDAWAAPEKTYNYDEDNCLYCGNMECPIRLNAAKQMIEKFVPDAKEIQLPDPSDLDTIRDPEQLAKLLQIKKYIDGNLTALARNIGKRARQFRTSEGLEIPGWELGIRKGRATVTDPIGVIDKAKEVYGVSHEQLLECATLSLTQAGDRVAAEAPRGEKKNQKEEFIESCIKDGYAHRADDVLVLKESKKELTS